MFIRRGASSRANKPRCNDCGSTFLEPSKMGSIKTVELIDVNKTIKGRERTRK